VSQGSGLKQGHSQIILKMSLASFIITDNIIIIIKQAVVNACKTDSKVNNLKFSKKMLNNMWNTKYKVVFHGITQRRKG
jgi:hypothetical protein